MDQQPNPTTPDENFWGEIFSWIHLRAEYLRREAANRAAESPPDSSEQPTPGEVGNDEPK